MDVYRLIGSLVGMGPRYGPEDVRIRLVQMMQDSRRLPFSPCAPVGCRQDVVTARAMTEHYKEKARKWQKQAESKQH